MNSESKDLRRSGLSDSHEQFADLQGHDGDRAAANSSHEGAEGGAAEIQDLGAPAIGWMPQDLIRDIVVQLDAELTSKTVG